MIYSVSKFFPTNNCKVTILVRLAWSIIKITINVSNQAFGFVNYVDLVNVLAPGLSWLKSAKLQSNTIETIENHVQSFHTGSEREKR